MDNLSSPAFFAGFVLALGLIVAVGPQNLHVLNAGLARRHIGITVSLCVGADLLLVALALGGVGAGLERAPLLAMLLRWASVIFLGVMAWRTLRSAAEAGGAAPTPAAGRIAALRAAALVTFANPAVYAETLLLVGGAGAAFGGAERASFGAGAVAASLLWFGCLGYGARFAARWLRGGAQARRGWQALNIASAALMALAAANMAWVEIAPAA